MNLKFKIPRKNGKWILKSLNQKNHLESFKISQVEV